MRYQDLKQEAMKDPEVKAEYDILAPQYEIISQMIDARNKNNMTQAELAQKSGLKQSNISRFENGKVEPTIEFLEKIALALGYTLDIRLQQLKQL